MCQFIIHLDLVSMYGYIIESCVCKSEALKKGLKTQI